jgi:Mrp family chromosome partitioning ATPase
VSVFSQFVPSKHLSDLIGYSGGGEKVTFYVPKPSEIFVMRKEPWSAIEAALIGDVKESIESSQRVMVISGLGGSGKTQLALKFAQEPRKR